MSLEACPQISIAALDAGIAPIARVPNGEYAIATRALDNGALGIVMPYVDTAAEAREVLNRLKYPPVGHRSMGGIGPHYPPKPPKSKSALQRPDLYRCARRRDRTDRTGAQRRICDCYAGSR